jgi:hypothetical protein
LRLKREQVIGFATRLLTSASALAVIGACLLSKPVFAQTDSATAKSPTKTSSDKGATKKTTSGSAHPKSTGTTAHNGKSKRSSLKKSGKKTARGQQKIDPQRAEAIQEALIREHYLSGEPAGTWNQASEDALRKYQADHGWQSKQVPDSRALISLGLGPSHDGLLNPESAMTMGPDVSHSASVSSSPQVPVSHAAEPGTPMNQNSSLPSHSAPASSDHDSPQ